MESCQAITDFQVACQKHFTCFTFAVWGLREFASRFESTVDKGKTLYIGTGNPNEGHFHSAIRIGDAIAYSQEDGLFADQIAKSILAMIYSEWEELYRPAIANEVGVPTKSATSDLMGDIRIIRNCIIHGKSVISDEHQKLKELQWQLTPGQLTITKSMFSRLIDQINQMKVRVT